MTDEPPGAALSSAMPPLELELDEAGMGICDASTIGVGGADTGVCPGVAYEGADDVSVDVGAGVTAAAAGTVGGTGRSGAAAASSGVIVHGSPHML